MSKSKKPSKPKVVKVAKVPKVKAPAKLVRTQRNGITQPGEATICGSVWSFLDAHKGATAADVIAGIKDINEATARTQFQRYRKFHEAK